MSRQADCWLLDETTLEGAPSPWQQQQLRPSGQPAPAGTGGAAQFRTLGG